MFVIGHRNINSRAPQQIIFSTLPRHHATREAAITEAQRLARVHQNSQFLIFEAVDAYMVTPGEIHQVP